MEREFSRETHEKYSNVKFNENTSSDSRAFPRRRTEGRADRYEEAEE